MKRAFLFAAVVATGIPGLGSLHGAVAGDRRAADDLGLSEHPKSAYYHRHYRHYRGHVRPQVRGYVARRGGYSFTIEDTLSTYGGSRSRYGGTYLYRDPMLNRQTDAGPFDHGFFFDSPVAPHGGESPYQH